MKNPKLLALSSTLAFLITLLVNALANLLPLNGLNTGEVSALYPSLFTPAGITFSIWSVIYLLLTGFVIYQWVCAVKGFNQSVFQAITPLFILSCILNAGWIMAWHYLLVSLSVVIMVVFLITLLRIFLLLRNYAAKNASDRYLIQLPFTLYFAWICVATIANISALLVSLHWSGGVLSPEVWTVVMMGIAALLAYVITVRFSVPSFAMVVMWALAGIFIRWKSADYSLIELTSLILLIALALVVLYTAVKKHRVA